MRVTIAICTWNRCELLKEALHRMAQLRIPADTEWELVVVNNHCTDATDEVIASFAGTLPIRRVYEAEPGLSNARNAAVREASGRYILWTDDDTLVDREWIAAYVDAFRRSPDAAVFGGPVAPRFMAPPPAWLESGWPLVADAFAARDLGPVPVAFDGAGNMPYGANYAVRLDEQRRFAYDPRLGVRAGRIMLGEETRVVKELLAAGFRGWWVPDARVEHRIPARRMTTRYLRRYYVGVGRTSALVGPAEDGPTILGRPRWAWKRAALSELKYRGGRWIARPDTWLRHLIGASKAWGYLLR
jgi:glycosyltransferase involved in cell wall biosynthesis